MNQTIIFNKNRRERKQRVSDLSDEIRYIVPFADWMDRHPLLTNTLLILMGIALLWVILTYEFTIPAYK